MTILLVMTMTMTLMVIEQSQARVEGPPQAFLIPKACSSSARLC
jgi:hypothetical protein